MPSAVTRMTAFAATFSSGVLLGALLGSRGGAAITTVTPSDGPAHVVLPAMVEEDVLQPSLPTVGRRRRQRRRGDRLDDDGMRRGGGRRGRRSEEPASLPNTSAAGVEAVQQQVRAALEAQAGHQRGAVAGAEVGAAAAAAHATSEAAAASATSNAAAHAAARRSSTGADPLANGARTLGPYYGDLEGKGELERAVRLTAASGELVLLHGNENRLRMLVNLVAELNSHGIFHALLLGFSHSLCEVLRVRGAIGCAHSSYLYAGALAGRARTWGLEGRYIAWLQKFHYMRLLLEMNVNVLGLDSDVVLFANPYPHLRGAFGGYSFVTAFDTKGGFANVNVGVLYLHNVSRGGPVHGLFVEFERRVELGLKLPPPPNRATRAQEAVRFFWDQNLFNKVLLSALAGRALYMPGVREPWTEAHQKELWELGRPTSWRLPAPTERPATPRDLHVRAPWYPNRAEYRSWELGGASTRQPVEKLLLAPPWLISADNSLGHRYKHWLYGATPPPCVMLHFVCVSTGEASRILPMRLFGRWHEAAVQAEQNVLDVMRTSPADLPRLASRLRRGAPLPPLEAPEWSGLRARLANTSTPIGRLAAPEEVRRRRPPELPELPGSLAPSAPGRRKLLALEPGTFDEPLKPRPWQELNALHAALGGLALLAGRAAVLPAINCTGVTDSFLQPGTLPNRCFWHVHRAPRRAPGAAAPGATAEAAWANGGVRCVFRLGSCPEDTVAPPTELADALAQQRVQQPHLPPPPLVDLRLDSASALNASVGAVRALVDPSGAYAAARVVRLRMRMPETGALLALLAQRGAVGYRPECNHRGCSPGYDECKGLQSALAEAHPEWAGAVRRFCTSCSELTDRSKKAKRECTNTC